MSYFCNYWLHQCNQQCCGLKGSQSEGIVVQHLSQKTLYKCLQKEHIRTCVTELFQCIYIFSSVKWWKSLKAIAESA